MKSIGDVKGICGDYIQLNFDNIAGEKRLTIDTYNNGNTIIELGVNEIDELIETLQKAKEALTHG